MRTTLDAATVGVGLRSPHIGEVLAMRPAVGWFEVHAENYVNSDPSMRQLESVRRNYPVSLHCVGLSLGSAAGVDPGQLDRLKELSNRIGPALISEHVSWSTVGGVYLSDLLPLPYTEEALAVVCNNIDRMQATLGRQILIENPSTYLRFSHSTIPEVEFICEAARRTGCGLLCDVNNIYVTSQNFLTDPVAYLDAITPEIVGEIHLAGHFRTERHGRVLLIDDHGTHVAAAVWDLYRHAVARFGRVPTLIEWDRNIPGFEVLLAEARLARRHAAAATAETENDLDLTG